MDQPCWKPFDECISALADKLRQLGNKQTLEVELRFDYLPTPAPLVDLKGFLPNFRGNGRVRIVHPSSGWVLVLAVRFPFLLVSS